MLRVAARGSSRVAGAPISTVELADLTGSAQGTVGHRDDTEDIPPLSTAIAVTALSLQTARECADGLKRERITLAAKLKRLVMSAARRRMTGNASRRRR